MPLYYSLLLRQTVASAYSEPLGLVFCLSTVNIELYLAGTSRLHNYIIPNYSYVVTFLLGCY